MSIPAGIPVPVPVPLHPAPHPAPHVAAEPLLVPGRTCWRVERAERVGVIVDAEDYFALAKAAMRQARRSIYLTAWDFDARIRLTPQMRRPRRPDKLGNLLNWLAATRPDLTIHVLKWDYAELFDLARWSQPLFLRSWLSHSRLQYRLDGDHPAGACHHQKMLVIDDRLAFCGGLDITANRWDTRAHRPDEPLRRQPDGTPYEPFHDVMMAVDGDAARALGDLFRERWRRATGCTLSPPAMDIPGGGLGPRHRLRKARRAGPDSPDPWPPQLAPLLKGMPVGIARTEPAYNGRDEVREVEALYVAAIASAERFIYMESQYFASTAVAEALKARLAEPEGPEVVIVNSARTSSWLENTVMLGARARLVKELREADRNGRFHFYIARTGDIGITIHAKVMVVDDRLLRIGSANLNNRSMGLDTECDLAFEAPHGRAEGREARHAIAGVRDDLIAEHLGVAPESVAAELRRSGSLVRTVEALRRPNGRTLEPLEDADPGLLAVAVADAKVFDPERPVGAADIVRRVLPSRIPRRHHWLALAVILAVAGGVWGLWNHTPLRDWATLDAVLDAFGRLRESAFGPLWLILLYVAGGFVLFPVLLLIAATAIALGPWMGFPTALAGVLASAAALFWVGRLAGQRPIERYGGAVVRRASEALGRRGVLAMAALRVVPVAPFTVVNLVAGASRIRFLDYLFGTVLGTAPGILVFNLLGHQLERVLTEPTPTDMVLLGLAAVTALGLGWAGNRLVRALGAGRPAGGETAKGDQQR
ncbi:phospholipase [Roseomonas genomospecies 6]|uniref:Phospholipase D n=1 Tax=Roseomonas genomospecies 6 TaxID=214106 RepID=A0A9W7NM03_9PROT|nr:phospholipase [Roseomonas genomospecies 6]